MRLIWCRTLWFALLAFSVVACSAAATPGLPIKPVTIQATEQAPSQALPTSAAGTPTRSISGVLGLNPGEAKNDTLAQATALANLVTKAGSEQSLYQALLQVFDALGIGVYSGQGRLVQRGAERGPNDFYLYDWEVRIIARSILRQDKWSNEQIAVALNSAGMFDPPVARDELARLLRVVVVNSKDTPEDPTSLLPLLVRELGLRQPQPYDLLQEQQSNSASFNTLQRLLIVLDAVLPSVLNGKVSQSKPNLLDRRLTPLLLRPAAQDDPCSLIGQERPGKIWLTMKLYKALYGANALERKLNVHANEVIRQLHQDALGIGIELQPLPGNHETHYGHDRPGAKLEFSVRVVMKDDLGEVGAIACGAMKGLAIDGRSVKGVVVNWETGALGKHGKVLGSAPSGINSDGIASLVFQPKSESPLYGFGPEVGEVGTLRASWAIPLEPKELQDSGVVKRPPKDLGGVGFEWAVVWHEQPQLKLRFNSALDGTNGGFWAMSSGYADAIPLHWDESKGWIGSGIMIYETNALPLDGNCSNILYNGKGSTTFQVTGGKITQSDLGRTMAPAIRMSIRPGLSSEVASGYAKIKNSCVKKVDAPTSFFSALWWSTRDEAAMSDPGGGFPVTEWSFVNDGTGEFARATLTSKCAHDVCRETTLVSLMVESGTSSNGATEDEPHVGQ